MPEEYRRRIDFSPARFHLDNVILPDGQQICRQWRLQDAIVTVRLSS